MRGKLLVVPVVAVAVSGGLMTAADAAPKASTTVTIKAQGVDLSGQVTSSKPKTCANERQVIVIKQNGARGGGDDVRFASDTASLQGGKYVWSTGNTGTPGKFYARVRPTQLCAGDTSPTIVAKRNP